MKKLKTSITLAVTVALAPGTAAEASFPGSNGQIAFVQEELDPDADSDYGPSTDFEVMVMEPDGSESRQLTFNDVYDSQVTWSADGTRLAVARGDDIYIIEEDGTESHPLGLGALGEEAHSPSWSPDGTKIMFTQSEKLYVKNADGSGVA